MIIFFDQSHIALLFLEINPFLFRLITRFWAETYWLQKNKETMLVTTEKNGHEENAEMPMHMSMSCEENANQIHNLNVNTIFLCGHIP